MIKPNEENIKEKYAIESDSTEIKLSSEYISKTKTKIILIKDKLSSSFFNDAIFTLRIDDISDVAHIIKEISIHKTLFPSIANHFYSKGKYHIITNSINNSISILKFFREHIDEVNEKKIRRIIAQLIEISSHIHSHKMKLIQLSLDDLFIDVDNDNITLLNILLIANDNDNSNDVKFISNVIQDMIKMYIIYIDDRASNPPSFRRNKSVHITNNLSFNKSSSISDELNELMNILTNDKITIDDIIECQFMKTQTIMKRKTMKDKLKKQNLINNDVNIGELVSKFKESQLAIIDEDNSDESILSKVISDCSKKPKKKKLISLDDTVDKKKKPKKSNLFSSAIVEGSQLKQSSIEDRLFTERKEETPIKITFKPLDMVLVNSASMELLEAAMKERTKKIPKIVIPEVNENNIWDRIKSIFT